MSDWNYLVKGQIYGPVDTAELQTLLRTGTLPSETPVWREGMGDWMPANSLGDFRAATSRTSRLLQGSQDGQDDVQQNKVYAIIAYISILFVVGLVIAPQSRFARYHANQGLLLCLLGFLVTALVSTLGFMPFVGKYAGKVGYALGLGCTILMVLGVVNAARGECKELPLIGKYNLLK